MGLLKGIGGLGDFFALDIGTNAVRVVQLSPTQSNRWNLVHYGYVPVDEKITSSDAKADLKLLGESILMAVAQSGIKEKKVVIGMPSSKTFTTVIDVPNMNEAELRSTMKYQIDQYIPISIDNAKVDWALLGESLHDSKQLEVLLTSTSNKYAEERLEFIEGLGFNVIAAEPDSIAMIRSLLSPDANDARVIIDMGERATDLAITFNNCPRLVRNIPIGLSSIIKAASQNLNVQYDQARQFVLKFGLAPDRLEGQVYRSIEGVLDNFSVEVVKSVKFFQTRYPGTPVNTMLLSGFSALVPKFGEYITAKTGVVSNIANPWQRVDVPQSDRQQLANIASEFATVIGLAERKNLK